MDLGLLYGCVVTLCLLSPAHCPDRGKCPCNEIPTFEAGQIGPLIGDCHQLGMALRYTCKDGYVRKAGSSNLLKCQDDTKQWKIPNLTCIPDPNRSHTKTTIPPSKTTPEPSVATTTSVPPSKTTPEPSVATTTSAGTSSTARPPADNNTPSASKSASSAATVAIVSGAALVIVAVGVGGVVLWYRRRAIDVVSGEEVIPMNTPA